MASFVLLVVSAQEPAAAVTDATFTLVTMYLKKLFHHLLKMSQSHLDACITDMTRSQNTSRR